MPDSYATLLRADTSPPAPMPRPRAVLPCWHYALAAGLLLRLFVLTIRAALREQGASGIWATIACWAGMGVQAALDRCDRTHGSLLPPRTDKWR